MVKGNSYEPESKLPGAQLCCLMWGLIVSLYYSACGDSFFCALGSFVVETQALQF